MKTFLNYILLAFVFFFFACHQPDNKEDKNTIGRDGINKNVKYQSQYSFLEIKKIASEVLEVAIDSIKPETKLTDIGVKRGIEDISYMELVMHIEAEFEIEIPDSEANRFSTIGEISEYVDKKAR
jgi:acyl carrier protein